MTQQPPRPHKGLGGFPLLFILSGRNGRDHNKGSTRCLHNRKAWLWKIDGLKNPDTRNAFEIRIVARQV